MHRVPLAVAVGLATIGTSPAAAQDVSTQIVVDGLDFPTGISFSPDGSSMYVNERPGRVRVVGEDGLRDEPLATIPTTTEGETGLLGIATSPSGSDLYVFVTDSGGASNRVLRVPVAGGRPEVVVSGLPASVYHNGGGVAFDRDDRLLVSNGETHESTAAQDPGVLGGKVYRFTPEGNAADNPFGDSIALGLRNPYGMTIDPVTGDAFVTENGPSSHDEVNRIRVGGNYGWPDILGMAGDERPSGPGEYHDPVTVREEIVVPTGIAFADPETALAEVAGNLFYGTFADGTIRRVELNDARDSAVSDEIFIQEQDPVIALAWGPRGLYYSTPTAVKVVELAESRKRDRSNRRPTETPTSPAGGRDDAPASDGGIGPVLWVAAAVVAAAAIGGGLFLLLRGRVP